MYYEIRLKKYKEEGDLEALKRTLSSQYSYVHIVDRAEAELMMKQAKTEWKEKKVKNLKIRVGVNYATLFRKCKNFELFISRFRERFGAKGIIRSNDVVDMVWGLTNSTTSSWLNSQSQIVRQEIDSVINTFVELFEMSYFLKAWFLDYLLYGESSDIRQYEASVDAMIVEGKEDDLMGLTTQEKRMLKLFFKQRLLREAVSGELSDKQKMEYRAYVKKIASIKKPKLTGFRKLESYLEVLNHGKTVSGGNPDTEGDTYKLKHKDFVSSAGSLKEVAASRKRKERINKIIQEIDLKISGLLKNI